MSKRLYTATVEILVEAEDRDGATDGINELLQENDFLVDWAFLRLGGMIVLPTQKHIECEGYKEGDFVRG